MNGSTHRPARAGLASAFAILLTAACAPGGDAPKTETDAGNGAAQAQAPTYAANVPAYVTTPDKVQTELLGDLDFFDGMPSKATVEKAYDFLDTSRGAEAFLNGIPAASIYALLEGLKEAGVNPGDLAIFEELMDARSLYLTPNSTTIYNMFELNVKDGPVVVEVPPGVLGPVDDAYFRFLTDFGFTGPDQGKGGKYLFVHRDYEGAIPGGYFVIRTPSYRNLSFFRAIPTNGDLKAAVANVKAGFHSYPLAQAANPPEQRFVNLSGKQMNTVHANDFHFYEEINAVVQYEPADSFDPEFVGLLASIGIKKGQPFEPDARMKKILTEAVAIGNATARAITFAPRNSRYYFYPDRKWTSMFAGKGNYAFYDNGERMLDDRIFMHYYATGITPAMTAPKVGLGSVYEIAAQDKNGDYLDGGKTYSVTLPGPVPAKDFWSFMVYSGQTRSMLETDQKTAGLDSFNPSVKPNADGSYTMWFGPTAPAGREGNWIQTMPGKSYNVLLRLYGPLEPWFDKSWKPGDFEPVP
ncbi:MAG: DUF1254 domain-containing protein [Gemmatimonadota bacterium]|nr:DUF1254 domain-containing protein [Gemmatimonadota bacterium]